ncbi:hypothetical protein HN51_055810, partial [Arachis hypogaea]
WFDDVAGDVEVQSSKQGVEDRLFNLEERILRLKMGCRNKETPSKITGSRFRNGVYFMAGFLVAIIMNMWSKGSG